MKQVAADIIKGLFILLFTYTSFSKLFELDKFQQVLGVTPLLQHFAGFLAIAVPAAEIIIVILLVVPAYSLYGFMAALFLLSVFTLYLVYMVSFAPHLPCSCGGVIARMSWQQHIFFNLFFIVLGCTGMYIQQRLPAIPKNKTISS